MRFCYLKNPKKKTKQGSDFKSINKIPRIFGKWLRKKNLASNALMKVNTVRACKRLKEIIS